MPNKPLLSWAVKRSAWIDIPARLHDRMIFPEHQLLLFAIMLYEAIFGRQGRTSPGFTVDASTLA